MKNLVCFLSQAVRNRVAFAFVVFSVATLGSALPARADFVTLIGNQDPNLQAFLNITSLTPTSITFFVGNELVPGVVSQIRSIGFDLPGIVGANNPGACSGQCGSFTVTPVVDPSPGNVPGFTANLDFALTTGPNFAGGNPPGIAQGQAAMFTVVGGFAGLTQANFLSGAYARFQGVSDEDFDSVSSDVAHAPVVTTPVPEPASVLLLGVGLLGIAAKRFRQ